ncbi:hypothetical protein INT44_007494 [Umbelopsis vinacea]|uniref:ELMO domain-containing protein n=1 Tax=Umbelopsis vinacea TaxID=44442 RepID=A0A8H7PN62_9FUNG|nr:hypothetical protein INT44_007494 [Umbelopsis vinacea]
MSSDTPSNDVITSPSPEEAENMVKRMSVSGPPLTDPKTGLPLPKDDKVLKIATFSLQKYLKEPEFAKEFLERGGLQSLCDIIKTTTGNTLAYALNSLSALMEHESGWDTLDEDFVRTIVAIDVSQTLVTVCRPATAILIKLVSADKSLGSGPVTCYGYNFVHRSCKEETEFIPTLVQRLQSPDYLLCLNSLELITTMLKHVTDEHRGDLTEDLQNLNVRKFAIRLMNDHPSEELTTYLLDFQTAYTKNAQKRRKTMVSLSNPRHARLLNDIWQAANIENVEVMGARKWKKIGFSTEIPQREFGRTGVFGLENMHSFAIKDKDTFAKMVLEQVHRTHERRCPFARASIEVTDLLSDYWNVSSNVNLSDFQPLMLSFDSVHHTTLHLFFRIFHDMEATTYDFSKVSALVRSQIRYALKNEGVKTIFEFDKVMLETPYDVIRDRRLKELEWADDLLGREAIRNLRQRLYKESYEFVKQQRIDCLMQGAWFPITARSNTLAGSSGAPGSTLDLNSSNNMGNMNNPALMNPSVLIGGSSGHAMTVAASGTTHAANRWRYFKLSPSKKQLHYGEFTERVTSHFKGYDKLTEKIDISSIAEVQVTSKQSSFIPLAGQTGLLSPGPLSTSNPEATQQTFVLLTSSKAVIAEFRCSSSTLFSEWTDGFSLLLDKGITNKDTAEYIHSLTEIGVKVKLLQIAGDRVEVPHGGLEIPVVQNGLGEGYWYQDDYSLGPF